MISFFACRTDGARRVWCLFLPVRRWTTDGFTVLGFGRPALRGSWRRLLHQSRAGGTRSRFRGRAQARPSAPERIDHLSVQLRPEGDKAGDGFGLFRGQVVGFARVLIQATERPRRLSGRFGAGSQSGLVTHWPVEFRVRSGGVQAAEVRQEIDPISFRRQARWRRRRWRRGKRRSATNRS
jgi:hypothetical protein